MSLPPDERVEHLPDGMADRLRNAFSECEYRYPASHSTLFSTGASVVSEMEVLAYEDGGFDVATPFSAYDDPGTSVVETGMDAIAAVLDAPLVIDHFGGFGAWTAATTDPENGEPYVVKEGVVGTRMMKDDRPVAFWSDRLYETAINTYSAAFISGNTDLRGSNVIVNRDWELVCIDHDVCDRITPSRYSRKKGVPQDVWEKSMERACRLAEERTLDGIEDAITDTRCSVVRDNMDALRQHND